MLNIPNHPLKLLVVGNGGREHALCWKLARSKRVGHVYCAPGNGGTAKEGKCSNVAIDSMDFQALAQFSSAEKIDLVVIGPENLLANGIVDFLTAKRLRVFGPTKEEAKLEWSKSFAKDFMTRHRIPTPRFVVADGLEEADQKIKDCDWARVVKADGLALGKGVFVCSSEQEVRRALNEIFTENKFGSAGKRVLLEEKVIGEELSLLLLSDGKRLVELAPSQDHKRRFDGDTGPNTGGMGAYSPVPLYERYRTVIKETILAPLQRSLADRSFTYKGLLYVGIIVGRTDEKSAEQAQVIEFNSRFGDPEAQAILPRMTSDLLEALWAVTEGRLDDIELTWTNEPSCCVVAVTRSYPDKSAKDDEIELPALPKNCFLFQAGTVIKNDKPVTAGGRILSVTGLASSLEKAAADAYAVLSATKFKDLDYRRDIARERSTCR